MSRSLVLQKYPLVLQRIEASRVRLSPARLGSLPEAMYRDNQILIIELPRTAHIWTAMPLLGYAVGIGGFKEWWECR